MSITELTEAQKRMLVSIRDTGRYSGRAWRTREALEQEGLIERADNERLYLVPYRLTESGRALLPDSDGGPDG